MVGASTGGGIRNRLEPSIVQDVFAVTMAAQKRANFLSLTGGYFHQQRRLALLERPRSALQSHEFMAFHIDLHERRPGIFFLPQRIQGPGPHREPPLLVPGPGVFDPGHVEVLTS